MEVNPRRQRAIDETRRWSREYCAGERSRVNRLQSIRGSVVVGQQAARGDFECPQFGEHLTRVYERIRVCEQNRVMYICVCGPRDSESLLPLPVGITVTSYIVAAAEMPVEESEMKRDLGVLGRDLC